MQNMFWLWLVVFIYYHNRCLLESYTVQPSLFICCDIIYTLNNNRKEVERSKWIALVGLTTISLPEQKRREKRKGKKEEQEETTPLPPHTPTALTHTLHPMLYYEKQDMYMYGWPRVTKSPVYIHLSLYSLIYTGMEHSRWNLITCNCQRIASGLQVRKAPLTKTI